MKTNIYPKTERSILSVGLLLAFCTISFSAKAQLKDCNGFLQGNYLEVGVNYNGAYGSSAIPPSGYHPTISGGVSNAPTCTPGVGGGIGFVADPAKDGWAVAAPGSINYFGDFFLPGVPQEGWSILTGAQVDCWNLNSGSFPTGVTGSNTGYVVAGSRIATTWKGTYDSLSITQRTVLDTSNTFFTIRVTIKNISHTPRYDIYYMRTVDPDNDQTAPLGSFVTLNKIEKQLPNPMNRTVVSARGLAYPDAFVSMGTKDLRAKCFIVKDALVSSTPLDSIYNETDTNLIYPQGDSLSADVGMGVVYKIDTLAPDTSTVIVMAYMFRRADENVALDDMGLMPGDITTNIEEQSTSTIKIAPNPFNNFVSLKCLSENDKVYLFDIYGKMLHLEWTAVSTTERNCNTSTLSTGMYILRVEDSEGKLKFKQMLQHD